jgi:AraC family transcriptional regulator, transcriptional activator of pobA
MTNDASPTSLTIKKFEQITPPASTFLTPASKATGFEIIWVEKGAGNCLVDQKRYPVANNTLICVQPGQKWKLHTTYSCQGLQLSLPDVDPRNNGNAWEMTWVTNLVYLLALCPVIEAEEQFAHNFRVTMAQISREYDCQQGSSMQIIQRYLDIILLYVSRQVGSFRTTHLSGKSRLVREFTMLVDNKFRDLKLVTQYASRLRISPNYLNEAVKSILGYPASHYIRNRIILEAKRKAIYSNESMKEIAYSLGFDNTTHFSKYFKHSSGICFSTFKKEGSNIFDPA